MKFLYITLRNTLLFYFFVQVINGIRISGGRDVLSTIFAGLLFGGLIASIPSLLKFFKLPVSTPSTFLMALILSFVFFFLLYSQVADLGSISSSTINLGLGSAPIRFDNVQTMIVATVSLALSVVGMDWLAKQK